MQEDLISAEASVPLLGCSLGHLIVMGAVCLALSPLQSIVPGGDLLSAFKNGCPGDLGWQMLQVSRPLYHSPNVHQGSVQMMLLPSFGLELSEVSEEVEQVIWALYQDQKNLCIKCMRGWERGGQQHEVVFLWAQ